MVCRCPAGGTCRRFFTRKALSLITTYGLARGPHAVLVRKTLTMDALLEQW